MPPDVLVSQETHKSVTLVAQKPHSTGGLTITSWMVKYNEIDSKNSQKTVFFGTGRTFCLIIIEQNSV